ncbi:MAG: UDP-N-acetylmuramoyl-tripeptide--D-alanyl-D-alanine ligase [Geothrix sp.]|uniref:UDP-N-acetylmuramoyl-tripeptide--D-alanyl-D- alanine ligase n=1 Tax=Geothrix sp. TaxID=1962974 RepID=UPI00180BAF55|nr:UDP-N-acetylmuramoyl-tripeptide--D-alanyl-D-alanine ligase [Geothrix sp.]NWJ42527.1 UDP-N-acetylmuramoyl-tripeptide--D-alanyl-D-alanine ligase [Geothrix sp.]WIL19511.1 MAG: UDP-N-acetylmuramoyl-tripeptide--D-alanyl-D-alanine ligase [Geothrix sp.]
MSLWSLFQAASQVGGEILGDGSVVPSSLSLDTRTLQPGTCFVALRAERDGHDFAAQAVEKGAAALLVDHPLPADCPQLVVPDTLVALQTWGQARLAAVRPKQVCGITGSVGKTSTKELLAAALGAWKTPGNRNNTLGLPEALATLPEGLASAVLELGMSTPGEIRQLTGIAPLDAGLITLVGTAHIENFPKGQQGIAEAKGELVAGLNRGGLWVHLASDPWCRWIAAQPWAQHAEALAVGEGEAFGWEGVESLGAAGGAFRLRTPDGSIPIRLQLPGEHQIRNAALATTLAIRLGHDAEKVAEGLGRVTPEPGRGRLHALAGGGCLLDETYNASSDSILACARALLQLPGGEAVAVLGSMRELGPDAPKIHQETGRALRDLGITGLWAYGDHAGDYAGGFGAGARAFPDFESLRDAAAGLSAIPSGARILVKGSRFWRAERAVDWLLAH